jgi:hypothetical protein
VRRSASERRVAQFALPIPALDATVFRRGSFGLARSAQHVRRVFYGSLRERAHSSRRLADPLRLSAEGAAPDGVTSDVLLSPDGATARAPSLPRSRLPRLAFAQPRWLSPSDRDFRSRRRFRATRLRLPGRLPSARCSALGAEWNARMLALVTFARVRSAPLSPAAMGPVSSERTSAPCYLPSSRVASRLPWTHAKKMLLTDFCNRHSFTCTRESLDSKAWCFRSH